MKSKFNLIEMACTISLLAVSGTLLAFGTGCGPNFTPMTGTCGDMTCDNSGKGEEHTQAPDAGEVPTNSGWQSLDVNGAISEGRFEATQTIKIDKVNKTLRLRLPMPANPLLLLVGSIPLSEVPGGHLTWEKLADGSPAMVVVIPLDKMLRGLDFPRKDKLPNGEDLPAVAGGELPSFAIGLVPGRDIKATIYLGPSVLAVFVNTPFDPYIRTPAIPILDQKTSRTLGYYAVIPATNGADGGFFISAQLPADIARIIDDAI